MATSIKFNKVIDRATNFPSLQTGINGHVIFCNGYLSSPKKNPQSYLNVVLDKVPDDLNQHPFRGANMSEKSLTNGSDLMTNKELELDDRQGGGTMYSEANYAKTEYYRWLFYAKEQFEGYWEGYDNISKKRFTQIFKEYFHANGNAHFINGSHGLQSSGAHRVEHGIAQGYSWARDNWKIKNFQQVERSKEDNPSILSFSPAYKPVTIVGHSQGAALAAGVAIGVLYYAQELGWDEVPVNLLFLATHQPQGLYGEDYEIFKKYYFEDFINEWVLEWVAEIFSKEKLKQKEGIYEKMNDLLGSGWGGLMGRAVQFTFPNDRALFVTRMGDIPWVKNACSETDALQIAGWYFGKTNPLSNFELEKDGYIFPKRLLNKAFTADGGLKKDGLSYKECVRKYWTTYNDYKNYRDYVNANPKLKYAKAKGPILDAQLLPSWFKVILDKAVSEVEKEQKGLYLQSELYRKKLNALMAFAAVHEMELQAHFAPVGLMFNKGTLSDWDQYQEQTIWDRIKEAGKDIFYRVEYSKSVMHQSEKIQEEIDYVQGAGKGKLVSTAIVMNGKVQQWINKAKEELKENTGWLTDIQNWWQGDKEYDGSGWAHGARTELAKALDMDDDIDNLFEAGIHSMLESGEVHIKDKSRLAKKLTEDPAFVKYEADLAKMIVSNPQYLKDDFVLKTHKAIQFGGERAKGAMWKQFVMPFSAKYRDTWKVAANELTWLIRSAMVYTEIKVKKDGSVRMNHSFTDKFDLRPSSHGERSIEYDTVSMVLGFLYHDVAGGNDLMKIEANWTNEYNRLDVVNKSGDQKAMKELWDDFSEDVKDIFKSLPVFK
ncbi:MAG TPA: hypothetical protein VF421_04620 [Niabella sp.]